MPIDKLLKNGGIVGSTDGQYHHGPAKINHEMS